MTPREPRDRGLLSLIRAMRDDPRLCADDIALVAVLATYADERGECYPKQATLAAALGRSRSRVNERLAVLASPGVAVVEKTRRRGEGGIDRPCVYRLPALDRTLSSPATCPAPAAVARDDTEPVRDSESSLPSARGAGAGESGDAMGQGGEAEHEAVATSATDEEVAPWRPSAADLAWAASRRPDLTPDDLALLAEKLLVHHAGKPAAELSVIFRRWTLTERPARHARHDAVRSAVRPDPRIRPMRRPSVPRVDRPGPGPANRDRALAALALLAG